MKKPRPISGLLRPVVPNKKCLLIIYKNVNGSCVCDLVFVIG